MATAKTRRKAKRSPIPVEVRSEQEHGARSMLERLERAGGMLARYNIDGLDKVLTLAETYVSTYELPDEPREVFDARMMMIAGKTGSA